MKSCTILLCSLVIAVNSDPLFGLNKDSPSADKQPPEAQEYNQTTTSTAVKQNTQSVKSTNVKSATNSKLTALEKQGPDGRVRETQEVDSSKTDKLEHDSTKSQLTKDTQSKNKSFLRGGFLQFQDTESTHETDVSSDESTREYQTDSERMRNTLQQTNGNGSSIDSRTYDKETNTLDETDVSRDTQIKTSTKEKKFGLGSLFSVDAKTTRTKQIDEETKRRKHEDHTTVTEGEQRYSQGEDGESRDDSYKSESQANQDYQEESQRDSTETVKKSINVNVLGMDIPIETPQFKLPKKGAAKPIAKFLGDIVHMGKNKSKDEEEEENVPKSNENPDNEDSHNILDDINPLDNKDGRNLNATKSHENDKKEGDVNVISPIDRNNCNLTHLGKKKTKVADNCDQNAKPETKLRRGQKKETGNKCE